MNKILHLLYYLFEIWYLVKEAVLVLEVAVEAVEERQEVAALQVEEAKWEEEAELLEVVG